MKGKLLLITLVTIGGGLASAAWAAARPPASTADPPPVSAVAVPQAATARVMAPIGEVDIGQTFPVSITITGLAANLSAFQLDLSYNRAVIGYMRTARGALLGSTGRTVICPPVTQPDEGRVRLGCATTGLPAGASGEGTLAILTFRALDAGRSPLVLSNVQLADDVSPPSIIDFTTQNGSVDVRASEPLTVDAGGPYTDPEGAAIGFTGVFTDPGSTEAYTITWGFGDGATATGTLTPTHAYGDDGFYTTTLTVTADYGASGSATSTVTIDNVAPAVDTGADQAGDEGDTLLVSATFSDPGTGDTHTATIDWDDGAVTTGTVGLEGTVSGTHIYVDNDVYTVTVEVCDDDGGCGSDSLAATIDNVTPVVEVGDNVTISPGDTFSRSGSFTDPGADSWTATVDYDDGLGPLPLALTGKTFELSHTYPDEGIFTLTVEVCDDDEGCGSDSLTVTVDNVPPVVEIGGDGAIDEGDTFSRSGSFTDPDSDTWTATVDYGDGLGPQPLSLIDKTFQLSHTYTDDDAYTLTVEVCDDKECSSDSLTVTVDNVAPTVNVGNDTTLEEGDTFLRAGSFTDPGTDIWTATVDYGDGSGIQPLPLTDKTFQLSHTYTDDDAYTVTVEVCDEEECSSDTLTVTVDNVPPVVSAGSDEAINTGDTFSRSGSFTDPGADSWTATVDYDDGLGPLPLPLAGKTFELSHTYPDQGTFTVTVVVCDDEECGSDTLRVKVGDVGNVPPEVELGEDATIDEGDSFTRTASFSDPDSTTWTATVDYGVGLGTRPLTLTGKSFELTYTYTDSYTFTLEVCVTDDDEGTDCDDLSVIAANVPPTATFTLTPTLIEEGQSATLEFSDPFDPSAADTSAGFLYSYDCTSDGSFELSESVEASYPCVYTTTSTFTATGRIEDKDGGYTDYAAAILVEPHPPLTIYLPIIMRTFGGPRLLFLPLSMRTYRRDSLFLPLRLRGLGGER